MLPTNVFTILIVRKLDVAFTLYHAKKISACLKANHGQHLTWPPDEEIVVVFQKMPSHNNFCSAKYTTQMDKYPISEENCKNN